MGIFDFLKRKRNKINSDELNQHNVSLNTEIKDISVSQSINAISPDYSEEVPSQFQENEEIEFLKHLDNRNRCDITNYYKNKVNDYESAIDMFFKKGYLINSYKMNLSNFLVVDLKDVLKSYNLSTSGKKDDLINRIHESIPEEYVKSNSNYKIRCNLSDLGKKVISEYFTEKDNYNNNRDEVIFQEELNKESPDEIIYLQFDDLNNTEEFKKLIKKYLLLCKFKGQTFDTTVRNIVNSTNEVLNCPDLDKFITEDNSRPARGSISYEDKIILYLRTKSSEVNFNSILKKFLDLNEKGVNSTLTIYSDLESCQCSTCSKKDRVYTYEDLMKNKPKFPCHYGCFCGVKFDF